MSLLRIEQLNKSFGSLVVSRDLDLEVRPGERHIVIGPNGAGKTTLLHQIGGQVRPTSGRIWFDGMDITPLPPEARARRGLARTFQKNTLFANLSVFENVRLGIQAAHGSPYNLFRPTHKIAGLNDRTAQILERMGLTQVSGTALTKLSYGDLRQIEVAVALSSGPKLLLLDEPTSGLSPAETRAMIATIKNLPRQITILMIEHDMEVVFSVADRISVLYYGELIASGSPEEVRADRRVQEIYLGGAV